MEFWQARWASRLRQIKELHKTKNECFWVTFKLCLIQDPQIPNFYLANLETEHFLRILTGPQRLGAVSNQKVE